MAKRTIITIGREFGSGGREIGQALASTLGIAYYDRELLVAAAKDSGRSVELFENNDEKPVSSLLYSLSVNPYAVGNIAGANMLPLNQKLFLAQFETIQRIAREHDCVIVGRCADYALRSEPDCLNVFIHAPLQYRIARIKQRHNLDTAAAKELIVKTDKKRAAYYNSYSDKRWGDLEGYHLTLDSSVISTDGAVELIKSFASMRK